MPPRIRPFPYRPLLILALLVIIALVRWWNEAPLAPPAGRPPRPADAPAPTSPADSRDEGHYRVARVVDGDTLLLTDGTRVRLLGVNTPETVKPDTPVEPWGPEASQFTRDFVAGGAVRLQFDPVERIDEHGRTLAYLYVEGRMLNEELIRAGLSRAQLQYPYSGAMKSRFRRAEQEARAARRGLWSQGGGR